jgi:hypothetical protein
VRTWHVIAFSTVTLIAAACTSSTTTTGPSGYSVPLGRIVADANAQNQGNPFYRLAPPGTKVPMSEATAARAVISEKEKAKLEKELANARFVVDVQSKLQAPVDDLRGRGHRARVQLVTDGAIAVMAPRIGARAACAAAGLGAGHLVPAAPDQPA